MGDEIDLRGILGTLRRRFLLILGCVVLCTLVAGLALFALKPVYSATTLVLVDPSRKDLLDPSAQVSASMSDSARVDSEVELVKSETTLLSVVQQLNLVQDPEFGVRLGLRDRIWAFLGLGKAELPTGKEALNRVVDSLRAAVAADRRGMTFLVAVSARSGRPDFAATLANTVADTYITQQVQSKISSIESSRDIIQARIAEAGRAVAQSEESFDQFIDENLQQISKETGRADLVALRDEIEAAIAARDQQSGSAQRVEAALSERDWASVVDELRTEAVRQLEQQRARLQAQVTTAADDTAVQLRAQLAKLETDLSKAATQFLSATQRETAEAQERVAALRTQLRTELLNASLPAATLTSLYQLQQTGEISRRQYQTLLSRQAELETQAFLQVADSRVASPAVPASSASFPNARLFILAGVLAGLGIGVGLALLTENFIGGFADTEQLEGVLKVPALAAIPWQKPRSSKEFTAADNMVDRPLSAYAEGVRRMRVGIDQLLKDKPKSAGGRVIVITSAGPGEGKSSLALSLARSYALNGRSTLLIDCDLRRPSLHRYLHLQPSTGLLDYLSADPGAVDFQSILSVDEATGARVVVGQRPSDRPTDKFVAGATFHRLIEAARRNFEYIILDTPPAGPVVDAFELSALSDLVIYVVKWASTPQSVVKATVKQLRTSLPGIPMRLVLNQSRESRAAYRTKYGEQYVT